MSKKEKQKHQPGQRNEFLPQILPQPKQFNTDHTTILQSKQNEKDPLNHPTERLTYSITSDRTNRLVIGVRTNYASRPPD